MKYKIYLNECRKGKLLKTVYGLNGVTKEDIKTYFIQWLGYPTNLIVTGVK